MTWKISVKKVLTWATLSGDKRCVRCNQSYSREIKNAINKKVISINEITLYKLAYSQKMNQIGGRIALSSFTIVYLCHFVNLRQLKINFLIGCLTLY